MTHAVDDATALVITGTVGAGKSTTIEVLSSRLTAAGIKNAAIDADQLRLFFPRPEDDPFGTAVGLANLADVAARYLSIGVRVLLIADVVEDAAGRAALALAVRPAVMRVVRLDIAAEHLLRRLRARESDETIDWYLERGPALQLRQRAAAVGDLTIEVADQTPGEVADLVLGASDLMADR